MLRSSPLLFAGLAAAACLWAQSAPAIDNDQVRVVTATDQPHAKSQLHEYKLGRVLIYLQAGQENLVTQDGKKTTVKFKAGEVKWSPPTGMHTGEITSAAPVTIVECEVKKPGDPAKTANVPLDPLKVSPKNYHLEFENSQVRVMRVHYAAHQALPQHEHVLNRVVVYLTEQHSQLTLPDGKTEESQHHAGQAGWGVPAKHKEENLLDAPMESIVIEFKN